MLLDLLSVNKKKMLDMQTHDNKKGIQIVKYFSNNKENAYITHDRTHSSVKMQLTTHIYMQQTV